MKRTFVISVSAFACFMSACFATAASEPPASILNLDFREIREDSSMPAKWEVQPKSNYATEFIKSDTYNYMKITGTSTGDQFMFGNFFQVVDGDLLAGKHVVFSAEIKTEDVSAGYAGLILQIYDAQGGSLGFDNTHGRGVAGTADWTRVSIEMDVNPRAQYILMSGYFPGTGTALYRNVELMVDGQKFVDADTTPEPTEEEIAWLRQYIHPLTTADPAAASDKDMQVLSRLIGDASVVALGECTHGSREIFQMKHRVMKYLAENDRFDIFSIEANLPESYRLNDYILRGEGDPAALIWGMYFWTWATEEVRDMVEWMKRYHDGGGKIQFTGFDMQYSKGAIAELRKVFDIDPVTSDLISELESGLQKYETEYDKMSARTATENELRDLLRRMNEIIEMAAIEEGRKEWLRRNAEVIDQSIGAKYDVNNRDRMMAANLLWIKEVNPGSRIVAWAHNGHVQKTNAMMGSHLNRALGEDYVNIGFATSQGTYRAVSPTGEWIHTLQHPMKGSYEYYFERLGEPIFILDLKKARQDASPHGKWLNNKLKLRSIGAMAIQEQFSKRNITDDFDYIIYIRDTGHSVALTFEEAGN